MNRRTWTISNILSGSRIVLSVPIVVFLLSGNRVASVALMVVAGLTDLFDGIAARALHQETDLGKILDPLADKIAVASIAIVLAVQGFIPLWFLAVVVARDLLILGGGIYIIRKKHVVLESNPTGKWTVTALAAYVIVATLHFAWLAVVEMILLVFSTAALGTSFLVYLQRFVRVVRQGEG